VSVLRLSSFATAGLTLACPADSELSEMDKAYISIAYPFPNEHPAEAGWSLKKALGIAGVPAEDQEKILEYAKNGKLNDVRATFFHDSMKSQRSLKGAQRAVSPSVIHFGISSPQRLERAFYNVITNLMDYLPETAQAKAVVGPGSNVMAVFDDPLFGIKFGNLLEDAVIALITRAKQGVNKSQDFHDILADPVYGPLLGNLLTLAVAAVKDSLDDNEMTPHNNAQHGMMDIIRHPVIQRIAETLLDEAISYVRDKAKNVASDPARAFLPAQRGAAHGIGDVPKTAVPIIAHFAQVALVFM
jgi:hypothetical protein